MGVGLEAADLAVVRRLIGIKAARDVPYAFDACFNSWLAVRGGDQRGVMAPEGPNDAWETYAQRPAGSIATSTELPVARDEPVRSGAHAELSCGISDWDAVYPVHQVRLRVSSTARVYDVDSAADWHSLVRRYRDPATHPGPDDSLRNAAGIDNGPAPTWSTVARDYDGVHLTFAGLLTGLYVPRTTEEVSTTLWAWNWESTHWLRSVFTTATPLDDLPGAPEDPGFYRPR